MFTVDAGYYLKFLSDWRKTFFLSLGASGVARYETINWNDRRTEAVSLAAVSVCGYNPEYVPEDKRWYPCPYKFRNGFLLLFHPLQAHGKSNGRDCSRPD
jgi:hypothetical protein